MEFEELDSYCREILAFCWFEKEIGFNQLARKVKETSGFSRPTLAKHLKHLVKAGFILKRQDVKSKLPLKPTFYRINREAIYKHLGDLKPGLSRFKGLESLIEKKDLENLAWELLRLIYFGDLVITRLLLESLKTGSKGSKRTLTLTRGIMSSFVDAILLALYRVSKTAKDEEINTILKEFDIQIERSIRFFQTGKLD